MYRMPWSLTDNPIGWLEVTDRCNINCKGCYRSQLEGHRDLGELKEEISRFRQLRNCDGISIAGGEPLLHPDLLDIVAHVRDQGMKAVLLSNAELLDRRWLRELKRAGCGYLTLHVDQWQTRKGYSGKDDSELLQLRQEIADRVDDVGGFHLTFGCTVYNENLRHVPVIARWAQDNAGKVDGLVFITFRAVPTMDNVQYQSVDDEVDGVDRELSYTTDRLEEIQISSNEVWDLLARQDPDFHSAAYLGGTVRLSSFKWIITARVLSRRRIYGYSGPRMMEAIQTINHTLGGTYQAYMPRSRLGALVFGGGLLDRNMRKGAVKYLLDLARHPTRILDPVHVQSIVIVQAPDLLPDGTCDMCDSCPDMTWYKGELVRSCRWDEYRKYGGLLRPTWKEDQQDDEQQVRRLPAAADRAGSEAVSEPPP